MSQNQRLKNRFHFLISRYTQLEKQKYIRRFTGKSSTIHKWKLIPLACSLWSKIFKTICTGFLFLQKSVLQSFIFYEHNDYRNKSSFCYCIYTFFVLYFVFAVLL